MGSVECLQISAKYFDCCEVRSASLSLLPPFSLLQLVSPPPPSWQQPLDGFNLQPHKGLEPEEFNISKQSRSRDLSAWRGFFRYHHQTDLGSVYSRRSRRHFCGDQSVRLHFVFPLVCQYCLYTTAPLAGSSAHRGRGGGGVKLLIKVLKVWEFMCREPGRWCHLSCSASFIHLNPGITHTLWICIYKYPGYPLYLHYISTSFTASYNIQHSLEQDIPCTCSTGSVGQQTRRSKLLKS